MSSHLALLPLVACCVGCFGASFDEGNDQGAVVLTAGGEARVNTTGLHLRDGIGTDAAILAVMPCGASVALLQGPSQRPVADWWQLRYDGPTGPLIGWASGRYLVPAAAFDPSSCGDTSEDAGSGDVFARARQAVGYSYYWGHGGWRADHAELGSCSGSCPACTHEGRYGADCSGFIAKVWQVPSSSPVDLDAHPFSTDDFYNQQVYWKQVPRSSLRPADALVRRDGAAGHIALVEGGSDPFGAIWLYEARGCATGVVHDLRTLDSSYLAIRRN